MLSNVLAAAVLVACGGHQEPENNDEDFNDAISAMSALGSAAAGAMEADEAMTEEQKETIEKIEDNLLNYKVLRATLPDKIEGFEKVDEDGETIKMGAFSISQATKEYKNGDKKLKIELLDYALASTMLNTLKSAGKMEVENDEKYHKSLNMNDNMFGWEEYNFKNKKSNVGLVLNDRLMLNVEVENADPEDALKIVKQLDLEELTELTK